MTIKTTTQPTLLSSHTRLKPKTEESDSTIASHSVEAIVPHKPIQQPESNTFSKASEQWQQALAKEQAANFLHNNQQAGKVNKTQLGVLKVIGETSVNPKSPDKSALIRYHGKDFAIGIVGAAGDTAKAMLMLGRGIWNLRGGLLHDPRLALETWKNLGAVVKTVASEPGAIVSEYVKPYKEAIQTGHPAKAYGRGLFEVVTAVAGAKGLSKLSQLSKGGKVAQIATESADDAATLLTKASKTATALEELSSASIGRPFTETCQQLVKLAKESTETLRLKVNGVWLEVDPTWTKTMGDADLAKWLVNRYDNLKRMHPSFRNVLMQNPGEGIETFVNRLIQQADESGTTLQAGYRGYRIDVKPGDTPLGLKKKFGALKDMQIVEPAANSADKAAGSAAAVKKPATALESLQMASFGKKTEEVAEQLVKLAKESTETLRLKLNGVWLEVDPAWTKTMGDADLAKWLVDRYDTLKRMHPSFRNVLLQNPGEGIETFIKRLMQQAKDSGETLTAGYNGYSFKVKPGESLAQLQQKYKIL